MDFKYKWKHGHPPAKDQAAHSEYLLDHSQFNNEQDRDIAEEQARRHLNIPLRVPDDDRSVLPTFTPERNSIDDE